MRLASRALFLATTTCLVALTGCDADPSFVDDGTGGSGAQSGSGGSGASAGGGGTGGSSTGGGSTGGGSTGGSSTGGGSTGGGSTGGGPTGGGGDGGAGQGGTGGVAPFCGDGNIDPGEECDDQNAVGDDGCDSCEVECPVDGLKDPVTFHCYFVLFGDDDWEPSRDACIATAPGTDLAALSTLAEANFVSSLSAGKEVWIGANDKANEDVWEWSNGEAFTYNDGEPLWASTQPDGSPISDQDCGAVKVEQGNLRMHDRSCSLNYDAMCERTPIGN